MKKQQICYIDDLSYGIPQVIHSIPQWVEYEFCYYNRVSDIPQGAEYDIVILDYYLDKDRKTALDIIDKFGGSIIIWFSSEESCNQKMLDNWAFYTAKKVKWQNINIELKSIMEEIL